MKGKVFFKRKTYKCPKGFRGRYSGVGLCEKTIIKLENVKENFMLRIMQIEGHILKEFKKVMM
jgi:hypothetical protein